MIIERLALRRLRLRWVVAGLAVAAAAAMLLLGGCGSDGDGRTFEPSATAAESRVTATPATAPSVPGPSSATPATASPTTEPSPGNPPAGFHGRDVRTGIDEVDWFLEAIAERDVQTLRERVVLTAAACTAAPGGPHPEPTCPEGVADGTEVRAFLRAACQPFFTTDAEEAREAVARLTGLFPYAVYTGGFGVPSTSPAAYTVVLGADIDDTAYQVSLDRLGNVIGVVTCSLPRPDMWEDGGPGENVLVLEPVSP